MADTSLRRIAMFCLLAATLAGCGKKGPLYLPDTASEVVTRPAEAPAPAPEVSAPESSEESPKKDKAGAPPPQL